MAHTGRSTSTTGIEVAITCRTITLESFPVKGTSRLQRRRTDNATFATMPAIAQVYVAAVVVVGAVLLVDAWTRLRLAQPPLAAPLAALGVLTSAVKIELPLGRSRSNLSLSHVVN